MTPQIPTLTLYRVNGSCAHIPHLLLTHLSLPFTAIRLASTPAGYAAADASFSHADYLTINPSGYVPALKANDAVITEMPAILSFIASLAPTRQLLGTTNLEKAKVLEWLVWLSGSLHGTGYGALWRPQRFVEDEGLYSAVREKGQRKIGEMYERIEGRLPGDGWAVGGRLTVVDFNLYLYWRWGRDVGVEMGRFARFREVARMVEGLGGVREVNEVEGLGMQFE